MGGNLSKNFPFWGPFSSVIEQPRLFVSLGIFHSSYELQLTKCCVHSNPIRYMQFGYNVGILSPQ